MAAAAAVMQRFKTLRTVIVSADWRGLIAQVCATVPAGQARVVYLAHR
jgi:hypothetical protein